MVREGGGEAVALGAGWTRRGAARLADDLASASGVKEQGAGIYAQNLAERGFVAMAFDESFNGESGGEPRHVSSPDIFVEDFSAGVD